MNNGTDSSPLALAKDRVTIHELGARYFPSWQPGKSCVAPFRQDRHPSFSVFADGRYWKDFATGEHGDAVDFIAKARGLTKPDAARELIALAGRGASSIPQRWIAPPRPKEPPQWPTRKPTLPVDLAAPTADELDTLAKLRCLPGAYGLVAAAAAGHLFIATLNGVRVWIITDSTRRSAQARRMDGEPWRELESAKAWTLRGSAASWPIGCADFGGRPRVLVAEGGPDFLCLWHLIATTGATDCAPVAMLGAGQMIHPDASRFFRGKDVTIYPHIDPAGQRGRDSWARQLYAAGAEKVRAFDLAPRLNGRGKDINDLLTQAPDGFCPTCWNRRIVAPIGGPTCPCAPYTWPVFTADQLANDFSR